MSCNSSNPLLNDKRDERGNWRLKKHPAAAATASLTSPATAFVYLDEKIAVFLARGGAALSFGEICYANIA